MTSLKLVNALLALAFFAVVARWVNIFMEPKKVETVERIAAVEGGGSELDTISRVRLAPPMPKKVEKPVVVAEEPEPEPSLLEDMTLKGVFANSADPGSSIAIISVKDQRDVSAMVGDEIIPGITLESVRNEYVTLLSARGLERLDFEHVSGNDVGGFVPGVSSMPGASVSFNEGKPAPAVQGVRPANNRAARRTRSVMRESGLPRASGAGEKAGAANKRMKSTAPSFTTTAGGRQDLDAEVSGGASMSTGSAASFGASRGAQEAVYNEKSASGDKKGDSTAADEKGAAEQESKTALNEKTDKGESQDPAVAPDGGGIPDFMKEGGDKPDNVPGFMKDGGSGDGSKPDFMMGGKAFFRKNMFTFS